MKENVVGVVMRRKIITKQKSRRYIQYIQYVQYVQYAQMGEED